MTNYVRFDWMIKRLLRNKADTVVLEGFLSVLLKRQIHITKILESEGNQDEPSQKFNRVDVLVEDENKAKYIIEVQNDHEIDFFQRMLFGTSKIISQYTKLGEEYGKITKVYSVNIVYFGLGQGDGYIYKGDTIFRNMFDENDILQLTKRQQELYQAQEVCNIFPEYYILKVNNFDEYAISPLQQWVSVLKTGDIPVEFTAQGLPEARELLSFNKLSEDEKQAYRRYLEDMGYAKSMLKSSDDAGFVRGHAEGRAEGRAEGENMAKLEIVRNAKAMGMSMEAIMQLTNLSEDEIAKIIQG
ncbi:MAG: Rpn family recombination-promoting nuclease/putative transposase [Bacteroidales bacterium]|nr:Rpn family recombination-promoting nuclease/putative transposase [Bacteroidales bacterium]